MPSGGGQLQTEDYISFSSAILGALGSTIQQQNSPQTLLLGLVAAAVAKALPSLGHSAKDWSSLEDWVLFLGGALGYLAAGIQSNFNYSDPSSQKIVIAGLAIGLAGKALGSLIKAWKEKGWGKLEDWLPLIAAVATALGSLQWGIQFAAIGIFFGFLGKQLASSPGDGAKGNGAQ